MLMIDFCPTRRGVSIYVYICLPCIFTSIHLDFNFSVSGVYLALLLFCCQEFKNALREDTVDYSTYTANIKRKRPPPPRRSVKAAVKANMGYKDDDDYDDDEEWGNGISNNMLHRSTQRGRYSSTRSRQRQ